MTQRVLVTAGASGIGMEIARTFMASGAQVSISGQVLPVDNDAQTSS